MITERPGGQTAASHTDGRVRALQALLDREGLDATAGVAGGAGEIAAVRAQRSAQKRLAELSPEIRALGFRYVTLELG